MTNPICPYCNSPSELVTGETIYPHRKDLYHKRFYNCAPCNAYVGCHGDTDKPLGRLANAGLRSAKKAAHANFDPLWKNKVLGSRPTAYKWLAAQLGIKGADCHIGMFDVAMCKQVIAVCRKFNATTEDTA